MDHTSLVKTALGIHAPIIVAALAAYYKFGDRSQLFERSLRGADAMISSILARAAGELAEVLRPLFSPPSVVPTATLLTADGAVYSETATDPTSSERYLESLRTYTLGSSERLADYRRAVDWRRSWCGWSRRLGWVLLALVVWEAVVLGSLALTEWLFAKALLDSSIQLSILPTIVLVFITFLCAAGLARRHDQLMRLREKYDPL